MTRLPGSGLWVLWTLVAVGCGESLGRAPDESPSSESAAASDDTASGDSDSRSDSCDSPGAGPSQACGEDQPACPCGGVCGQALLSQPDAASFTGFSCLASCSDEALCADPTQGCVETADRSGSACVPLGEVPKAPFALKRWSVDHAPENSDVVPINLTVAAGARVWTTTWGVAAAGLDPVAGEVVYLIFGADPSGVVVRYLYFIIPAERFGEGVLPMFDPAAPTPEAGKNFDIAIFEDIYGNGFGAPPTATHYMAWATDATIELTHLGPPCDLEADCEPTTGSVQAALLALHSEVAL